jgi:hypothetical protein
VAEVGLGRMQDGAGQVRWDNTGCRERRMMKQVSEGLFRMEMADRYEEQEGQLEEVHRE